MESTARSSKVTVKSSDGEEFIVDEALAKLSQTICQFIIKGCDTILLSCITGRTLRKVIEYCKEHVQADAAREKSKISDEELKIWDSEFVDVDQTMLIDLITAADYLAINGLLDLTASKLASRRAGSKFA